MERASDAALLLRICDSEDLGGAQPTSPRLVALAEAGLLIPSLSAARPWCLTERGARWLAGDI